MTAFRWTLLLLRSVGASATQRERSAEKKDLEKCRLGWVMFAHCILQMQCHSDSDLDGVAAVRAQGGRACTIRHLAGVCQQAGPRPPLSHAAALASRPKQAVPLKLRVACSQ